MHLEHGLHHFHKRKRIHQKLEPYPHPNKWKRLVDHLIYVVGIFGPIMTVPQLLKIWVEKNAAGVSAVSWTAYFFASLFWLIYGLMHKEGPIIFNAILWIILEILIVVGAMVYG